MFHSAHTYVHLAVMLFNLVLCNSVFSLFLHDTPHAMLLTLVMQLISACHADIDHEGPDVDCDVIAHGSGTRMSSHVITDVDSDEDSEDDSDVMRVISAVMLVVMWAEMWIVLC